MLTRRALLPTVLIAAVLASVLASGLAGAAPAAAVEPTPTPTPTQVSTPSLSPPTQQQIDDAKDALERLRNQGKGGATPTTLTKVAGPTAEAADSGRGSVLARVSAEAWWTIGAGMLVLLVASETTRLGVKRAKHRKGA